MGTELAKAAENPLALISSPDLRMLRRISLGTVEWPGIPPRKYLSGGSTLTDSERRRAEALLAELEAATLAHGDVRKEQFGLISKMLLTYPVANASTESGKARGEAYLEALDDVPPVVLAQAIRQWNRGEAGDHDYRWAPAPAVLRAVCTKIREPLMSAAADLRALLGAVSLERAMDPKPLEAEVPTAWALRRIA